MFALDLGAIGGTLLAAGVLVYEVRQDGVEIEPIAVPDSLQQAGLDGGVLTQRIIDRIIAIQQTTRTTAAAGRISLSESDRDFVIPGSETSITTIATYIRRVFGIRSRRIRGELTVADGMASLRLRLEGEWSFATAQFPLATLDDRIDGAAEQVMQRLEPYILASSFYDTNKERALSELRRITSNPASSREDLARAYNLWGLILYYRNLRKEALEKYDLALQLSPRLPVIWNNIGMVLDDEGDVVGAIRSYRRAIELNPGFALAYVNLAIAGSHGGDDRLAIDSYRQAVRLNPRYARAYNSLGWTLEAAGDIDGAIKSYRMSIEADPNDANTYLNIADPLRRKGDYKASLEYLDDAKEIEPSNPEILYRLAETLDIEAAATSRYSDLIKGCGYLMRAYLLNRGDSRYAELARRIQQDLSGFRDMGHSCSLG